MRVSYFIILLFFNACILNAQTDFKPGYVITISGDTLLGEIDYRGDILMGKVCKFKASDSIKEYSPNDISAFRFIDSKYYVSKEINDNAVFAEFLINGEVDIYYLRDEEKDHYFIEKEEMRLIEIPYEEGVRYLDNERMYFQSTKHFGLLSHYMQDAPQLKPRINDIKKPDRKNLIKLARNYHKAVCEDEICIIYEKSLPFLKIKPELTGGFIHYQNVQDLVDKDYLYSGIILHLWMPTINEKLYCRTGFSILSLEFLMEEESNEKRNFFRIPLQLEYIYPKGLIRPKFSYGLNFYNQLASQSVSFNLGANVKLSESVFFSLGTDLEFDATVILLPNDWLSGSWNFGVFLDL